MSDPAFIAAHQAADALAALLLHVDELSGFGDVDVVGKLAEALSLAIDVHVAINVEDCDLGYRAALADLKASAEQYIEGWVG